MKPKIIKHIDSDLIVLCITREMYLDIRDMMVQSGHQYYSAVCPKTFWKELKDLPCR